MTADKTKLKGCWIIAPHVFEDERGFFYEGFNKNHLKKATGVDFDVKQINQSKSKRGVLRGLHFQHPPHVQAKLVSCTAGEILDVAVDLRKKSPTYGQYEMVKLTEFNKKHLLVPEGMAHGFLVLSDHARIMYQVNELYVPECDSGIMYNDKDVNIDWGVAHKDIMLSEKDKNLPTFKESKLHF